MRGVDVTLVEKGNLTHGTTGRMHGLLHSGGRYAVSDQASATECIEENVVLREIATHCVEETGGLFVKRPEDSESYFQEKLEGCRACEIPAEVLSGAEAREREPRPASANRTSPPTSRRPSPSRTRPSTRSGSASPTPPAPRTTAARSSPTPR